MESGRNDQKIYEFADFRLIPGEGLLIQEGVPVFLQPKAFAVLAFLVERNGHLVTKSEIIDTIWEESYVEEASVSKAVFHARHALGDSSQQQFIQTVPRRGYRFVAPVKILNSPHGASSGFERISTGYRLPDSNGGDGLGSESIDSDATTDTNGEVFERSDPSIKPTKDSLPMPTDKLILRRGFFRRRHLFAISAVVVISVGLFAAYISYPWTRITGNGRAVTIAVLPFRPVNTADGDGLYGLGIADALINRLSPAENLQVRSLSSVRRYVDLDMEATAAGREQKVDYVLASNYQVAGGKIRITAQLIDISAGRTVEAFDFLKDAPDAFTAQNAVSAELRERLSSQFGARTIGSSVERGTNNEEAYRYYLLAKNFNELRGTENGRNALEQIEQAVALDPNFARAWAWKAYIHRYIGYGAAAHEHYLKSMEAVGKALAIDPNLSEAHSVLCFNKLRYEYDFAGAERACKRALELDPNSPLARKLYSNFLYTRGRFDEAIKEIRKAIDLQPVSYDNQQTYALALYFARRYPEAEAQWKALLPLNPNHRQIYGQLVRSLLRQGKESEAFDYLIELLILEKADEDTIKRFRIAFAKSGWRGVTLERIRLGESQQNPATFELARFYASVNDKNNAFKYLERAYQERSNMIAVLGVDPELDPLQNDPRFADLIRRVEGK